MMMMMMMMMLFIDTINNFDYSERLYCALMFGLVGFLVSNFVNQFDFYFTLLTTYTLLAVVPGELEDEEPLQATV